jgi:hypothetical protein
MRQDWRIGFPHFPAVLHITVSSVKLCLLLNDDVWNGLAFKRVPYLMFPKVFIFYQKALFIY